MPDIDKLIADGVRGAASMGKEVAFPDARSFWDLFSEARPLDASPGSRRQRVLRRHGEGQVTSYCGVVQDSREGMDVTARERVLDYIVSSMLASDYRISFGIVPRPDGTALVYAAYDRILGDRWLAIVDLSTVPGGVRCGADPDLYSVLKAAGCELDSHESDLYVLLTDVSRGILALHGKVVTSEDRHGSEYVRTFKGNPDGRDWVDVPFAYMPFWAKQEGRGAPGTGG